MNRILQQANRRTTVGMAAFLISGSYLASRLLGLLRDRLLVGHFGVGPLTDAYTAAFRLPELLFTLLVSGAFAVAFIPVLTQHLQREQRQLAWEVSSSLLNLLALGTIGLGVIIFIFASPLTTLVTPGFDPARHATTVELTRIMLVTPFLFAISSVFGSIQQAFGRFVFFALSGIFYNLGIIAGILFLSPNHSIYGVAYGVVIGTAIQALVQILGMLGLGYRWKPVLKLRNPDVRKVLALLVPRSIDQGIDQLHYMVETIIGSRLAPGSLSALYHANNLKNVPLVIFGNAIATAAFPRLSRRAAEQNRAGLIEDFVINARLILFLVIPAATIAILMRGYIVRLLFGFGNATTAATLGWFSGTIVFESLFFLVARVYYALQDTRTPLYVSLGAILINIPLSFLLSAHFGVVGLAMSQSAIAGLEVAILLVLLRRRLGLLGGRQLALGIGRMLMANLIMASVIYILVARILPLYAEDRGFLVVGPKFALIALAAVLSYLIPCYVLQLREAKTFAAKLRAQLVRSFNLN